MDTTNPYTPPASEVIDITQPEPAPFIPPEILLQIKQAWIAGIWSAGVTLLAALVSLTGRPVLGMGAEAFIDVALIAGLTWGIYRRSRACAVAMLVYFLISKAMLISGGNLKGLGVLVSLGFLYCYVQGVRGTYAYRRLLSGGARQPPADPAS